MRPRILLDVDGVLADFVIPVLAEINRRTCEGWEEKDVTSWDIYKTLAVSTTVGVMVDKVIASEGFCRGLQLYPGARAGVEALREIGDVVPVTAPFDGPHWIQERKAWLVDELGFERKKIVFTDYKATVSGDLLIDDKTSTLVDWQAEPRNHGGRGILFSRPWNVRDAWEGHRANEWAHLVALVKALVGGRS